MTPDNQAEIIEMYNAGAEDEEIASQLDLPLDEVADVIDAYDKLAVQVATNQRTVLVSNLRTFILLCIANYDQQSIYELFEDGCTQRLRDQIYSLADPDTPEPFRSAMYNMGFVDY